MVREHAGITRNILDVAQSRPYLAFVNKGYHVMNTWINQVFSLHSVMANNEIFLSAHSRVLTLDMYLIVRSKFGHVRIIFRI